MTAPDWLPQPTLTGLTVHAGRDEWLADRITRISTGGIGSTTASALLGLSPWRTPWECWAAVHAPARLDERPMDERLLARGLCLEPLADRLYREATGAETWGVDLHMTSTHHAGVICASPDAFALLDDGRTGVAEYKVVQPWMADGYPSGALDVATLADLDAASDRWGNWPAKRQYVLQCMVHLIATGLDFVDLFAIFAKDVQVGHVVDGWDAPVAVEGTSRLRINRDPETLSIIGAAIMAAHQRIIVDGIEPAEGQPAAVWEHIGDPLKGKREATAEEVETLSRLAELKESQAADDAANKSIRHDLREAIAASGRKGITAETDDGRKISATISTRGTLTIKGI